MIGGSTINVLKGIFNKFRSWNWSFWSRESKVLKPWDPSPIANTEEGELGIKK